ncbi:amidohydrolase [Nocardia sp. CA-128927]|uniref:amidohydrolase n=1 Tax=Nocardia sp. CA-128927 TaxID=3239975 RepID=UPI003D98F717
MCLDHDQPVPPTTVSRRRMLGVIGAAATITAANGLITACSDPSRPHPDPVEPVLLDDVRGYTCTSNGALREFGSLLIGADGRVAALDPASTGGARRIDGRGRVALPGMHDAHGHIWSLGALATQVDLSGATSLPAALAAITVWARAHPEMPWILGWGWDQEAWGMGRMPTAADLAPIDAALDGRPMWLKRRDNHAGLANRAALLAAGVPGPGHTDPPGGHIERDTDGRPTGVFVDTAKALIEQVIPAATQNEYAHRLQAAQQMLHQAGLTSVSEASTNPEQLATLYDAINRGRLTLRHNVFLNWDAFNRYGAQARTDSVANDLMRVRTVKLILDGALGSYGAALLDPYSDQPATTGLLQLSQDELTSRIRRIVTAGYQVAVHAIGDHANRLLLNAFEQVLGSFPRSGLRHRVEHAQVVALPDFPRIRRLGLIASMQPSHAVDDRLMAEKRIGEPRLAGAYAWRRILDQGTILAAGSDFPVASYRPFDGWHAAVTRTDRDGQPLGGWHREQAMTPVEALRAYTLDAARAAHQQRSLGTLEAGKFADVILTDQDPIRLGAGQQLWRTSVLQTWIAGRRIGEYGQL